jgi:hypothetical protein
LQVQDSVLRFLWGTLSPTPPTRGYNPLDPFFTRVWRAFVMFITPTQTLSERVQRGFAPLQVQDSVLRFSRFLQGCCRSAVSTRTQQTTRGYNPLDPFFTRVWRAFAMFITPTQTPSEQVQRGFAPLQVQDSVLRFLWRTLSPTPPTRGYNPLDPFFTRVWRAFVMFITPTQTPSEQVQRGFAPLQVQDSVLRFSRFLQGCCRSAVSVFFCLTRLLSCLRRAL